jgi:hypothetical protein
MVDTIITGLIVALVSGITILAFKYKKVFDQVFDTFLIILGLIFIGLFIWNIAIEYGFTKMLKYIDLNKLEIIKKDLPYFPIGSTYIGLIYISIQIYLRVLKYLTNFIKDDDKK